jgi:hypothetical protein
MEITSENLHKLSSLINILLEEKKNSFKRIDVNLVKSTINEYEKELNNINITYSTLTGLEDEIFIDKTIFESLSQLIREFKCNIEESTLLLKNYNKQLDIISQLEDAKTILMTSKLN